MIFATARHSISRKFLIAIMSTTLVAVLVAGIANLAFDVHDFRTSLIEDATAQAEILAQVSQAPLEFNDSSDATAMLQHLKVRGDIEGAAIYQHDGSLFAQLAHDSTVRMPATAPGAVGHTIDGNRLLFTQRIMRGNERIGTVHLQMVYPIGQRIARDLKILAAVSALGLLIAAIVSARLQHAVTRPVRALTEAIIDVVNSRNYIQRVPKTTEDEIGVLVDSFNGMLAEIGAHSRQIELANGALQHEVENRIKADEALRQLNNTLESRISTRTAELAQANEQLRHAQKMEAIGQLTGGVAHDFNNVLQVIAGNLQLLSMKLGHDPAAERRIETARFATERGAKLSSQLLAFARRQPLQPAPTNLARVLRQMDDMLRRALGECIEIETVVTGGLWNTLVDPYQMENVILNLAINARDAMDGDGRLTLELGNAMLDDLYVASEPEAAAGQYVMLAISDTGGGMPPEVLARAFEPFFTTKREGEGTGLGLSMAYGFVKQSGGHIKIYSEPGHGTSIKIYLPRSHQEELPLEDGRTAPVVGGSETILVVEDDLAVQATVVDMLGDLGYRVLKANDGQSALAIIDAGEPIDLLFTDVVMPGPVRSPDLARLAKERIPQLAVLFTSGYTQNAIVHGGRLDPGVELLSKPYRRDDLARKIRHLLGNRQQVVQMLKLVDDAVPEAVPFAAATTGLSIMLVEDEDDNRMLVNDVLQLLGHSVLAVASAEAALAAFAPGRIDVLMTDQNLPGMRGTELIALLREQDPELRVVMSSGAGHIAPAAPDAMVFSLPKPYDFDTLQQLLGKLAK